MQGVEPNTLEDDATAVFRRVLVPIDFSVRSHRAVHVALELQRRCGARVCVFNVSHPSENDQFLAALGNPATSDDLVGGGSDGLRRFLNNIAPGQADAVECAADIADDHVAAIRAKVSTWGATLVVLSPETHHKLLRTHSERLLQSLGVPVLVLQAPETKA